VAAQLLLWATIGLVFAPDAERLLTQEVTASAAAASSASDPVGAA